MSGFSRISRRIKMPNQPIKSNIPAPIVAPAIPSSTGAPVIPSPIGAPVIPSQNNNPNVQIMPQDFTYNKQLSPIGYPSSAGMNSQSMVLPQQLNNGNGGTNIPPSQNLPRPIPSTIPQFPQTGSVPVPPSQNLPRPIFQPPRLNTIPNNSNPNMKYISGGGTQGNLNQPINALNRKWF